MTASSGSFDSTDPHPAARADLREKVADLARARDRAKRVTATLDYERFRQEQDFKDTHAALLTEQAEAIQSLNSQEQSLRGLAIAFGETTGERKPVPGVELITQTKLVYQDADALAWALHSGLAVQLNRKELERIAKATSLPFVTTTQSLAVRLAADLDAALAESV